MSATTDKLNQIKAIKAEIKAVLLELGLITATTPFTEYANALKKLG